MWRSRTLLTMGSIELVGSHRLGRSILGMGTILPVFHTEGSVPVDRDRFRLG